MRSYSIISGRRHWRNGNVFHITGPFWCISTALHWRHNDHDDVSNHQPHGCLLNRLFRRRSKKTSKLRVTVLCAGNSPGPVNSRHKGPVTRKMFPFDDVIMWSPVDLPQCASNVEIWWFICSFGRTGRKTTSRDAGDLRRRDAYVLACSGY